jgi:SAM-dependent methyltransferase
MPFERPEFEEYWNNNFRAFAAACDDDAGISGWRTTGLETRLRNFRDYWIPDRPGSLWLDAGCGAGTYTRFLRQSGLRVLGLDYSLPSILKARARDSLGSHWALADLNHLPVAAGSVRGVLCFGVTQALSSTGPALRELVAATSDDGEVWLDALNIFCVATLFSEMLRLLRRRKRHLRYESPWQLRTLAKNCGLSTVRLFWLPILPQRWQRFQWVLETPFVRRLLTILPPVGALLSHSFLIRGWKHPTRALTSADPLRCE